MYSNTKTSKNILSRILKGAFIISIPAFFSLWIYLLWEKVPSQIHIVISTTPLLNVANSSKEGGKSNSLNVLI